MAMSTWRPTASLTMGSRTRSHKHSRECSKDAPSCSYAGKCAHIRTYLHMQVKALLPEHIKEFLNLLYRSRRQEAISPPARAVVCCGCHNSHAKRPRKQHSTHPSSTKGQNGRTTAIKNTPCACGNISLDCVLCVHLRYSVTHVWPQQQLDLPEQLERVRGTVQNI